MDERDEKLLARARANRRRSYELEARFKAGERGPELLKECEAVYDELLVDQVEMRAVLTGIDLPRELEY